MHDFAGFTGFNKQLRNQQRLLRRISRKPAQIQFYWFHIFKFKAMQEELFLLTELLRYSR